MSLPACIRAAQQNGEISSGEAEDLLRRHQALLPTFTGPDAERLAGEQVLRELRGQAAERRRMDATMTRSQGEILDMAQTFRNRRGDPDIGEFGEAMFESDREGIGIRALENRYRGMSALAMSRMTALIMKFRPRVQGFQRNKADMLSVAYESFGIDTGDGEARALAMAYKELTEELRQRYSIAGPAIAKRDDWGLSQRHDIVRVYKAGKDAWAAFVRERVDPARMIHPVHLRPMLPHEVDEALNVVWESIVSEGWNTRKPSGREVGVGVGRQEHRFLVFKDAESWVAYQQRFGEGDIYANMMQHIDSMIRDIAAMETFGARPDETVEWLAQTIEKAGRDAQLGLPSLIPKSRFGPDQFGGPVHYANKKAARVRRMWASYRGRTSSPANNITLQAVDVYKGAFYSAKMGLTFLTALPTDNALQMATRMYNDIPGWGQLSAYMMQLNPFDPAVRREALEAGVILQSALYTMGQRARFLGEVPTSRIMRIITDGVMRASLLEPHTQSVKNIWGMSVMNALANRRNDAFDDLPDGFRRMFERYGITPERWDAIRAVTPHVHRGAEFIRARDIAEQVDRELGEAVASMIEMEGEFATPTGSLRARSSLFDENVRGGTLIDVLQRMFGGLKTFIMTFHMTHTYRAYENFARRGIGSGMAYFASVAVLMTLGGAVAVQLGELARTRDPRNIFDPLFWVEAALKGGGLGVMGDFLYSAETAQGGRPLEFLSGIGAAGTAPVTIVGETMSAGAYAAGITEDEPNIGGAVNRTLREWTPGGNIWWLRAAFERNVFDQIQLQIDPQTDEKWARSRSYYRQEKDQDYWWSQGERTPERAPDWVAAIEER